MRKNKVNSFYCDIYAYFKNAINVVERTWVNAEATEFDLQNTNHNNFQGAGRRVHQQKRTLVYSSVISFFQYFPHQYWTKKTTQMKHTE